MEVLRARGAELEQRFPYGLVRQLFEPPLRQASSEVRTEVLGAAAALAAPLFDPRSLSDAAFGSDQAFAMLHGLFWLTANLAERGPLLLTLDDLHWSDAPSLRFFSYLVRRLEGLPIIVVAALRPDEPGADAELLVELTADPVARVRRLAPLRLEGVAELAREMLSEQPEEKFCAACHAATGGNPLLVRELLATLAGEGVSPSADKADRVRELGSVAVSRFVRRRLSGLPTEARELARAVAILGDRAELDHAAGLAGLGVEAAAGAATLLGGAEVLRRETPLSFVHPVVRAAIYAEIAPAERERRHAEAARLLADQGRAPEQVAAHLLNTSGQGHAALVRQLRDAARVSLAQGAPETAVAYLRRALAEPPSVEERSEVLLELGQAETLIDEAAAAEHLGAALDLRDDPHKRGEVALDLGRVLFLSGRAEEAVEAFTRAITDLSGGESDLVRRLQADLLCVTMGNGALYPLGLEFLDRIEDVQPGEGVGGRMLLALSAYHDALKPTAREACVGKAERALAGELMFGDQTGVALYYAAMVLVMADRFDAAGDAYEKALADARARGSIWTFATASVFRSYLATHLGSLADAEANGRAGLEAVQASGSATVLPFAVSYLADALMEQGNLEQAAEALDSFPDDHAGFSATYFFFRSRGRLRLRQGRTREALPDLLEAGRHYAAVGGENPAKLAWRSEAALAQLRLGQREEAAGLAAEELALARAWGAPRALGRALRVTGLAEGGEPGLMLLGEAVAVLENSPARLERAKALVELGATLRRGGRRSEAREPLRRGLELAYATGAKPIVERAQTELRATGARPRKIVPSGLEALTASERRVAQMAAEGMTNRDIAQSIFVTPKTVEMHLSSAYRKLDVASRAELPQALRAPVAAPGAVAAS